MALEFLRILAMDDFKPDMPLFQLKNNVLRICCTILPSIYLCQNLKNMFLADFRSIHSRYP